MVPELNDVGNGNALVHPLRLCLLSDPLHSAAAANADPHPTPIGHHTAAAAAHHRAAIAATQVPLVVLVVGPTIVLAAIFVRLSPKAELGAADVSGTTVAIAGTAVTIARPTVAIAGTALPVPGVSRLATRLSLIPHPKLMHPGK
jgi:hypothetical protein